MAKKVKVKKKKAFPEGKKSRGKKILLIHHAFPGQFGALARSLVDDGHEVVSLSLFSPSPQVEGVKSIRYELSRLPLDEPPFLLKDLDSKILRAESVAEALKRLKEEGFEPDVVYAHPGWGEALYVKEIFSKARFGVYAEWYYNLNGQEVNFDPEFGGLSFEDGLRVKLKNLPFLYALNDADFAIAPTEWQKSRFPAWTQEKIKVIHDGLPVNIIKLTSVRSIRVPEKNIEIKYGDPVLTYATRYLEPVRGLHIFLRALPKIMQENKKVHVFILGEAVSAGYGPSRPDGKTWKDALFEEIRDRVDLDRIHFMGYLPYLAYLSILRMSTCHVYLTIPFILGWSFLEAVCMGLPIVASDVPPVREFSDRFEGVTLVDFFDVDGLAEKILEILEKPVIRYINNVEEFDLNYTIPQMKKLLLEPWDRD